MFEINYDLIDPRFKNTIKTIESKPHVRFIRYLLTKRYSPTVIKKELFRLGLSAPHEPNLTAYYLCVIDPLTKAFGVSPLYSDYKNKLLREGNSRGDFSKDTLNYRLHIDNDLDMQVKFCKFIKFIEVGDLWLNEIYKYHGSAVKLPIDENGERILDSTTTFKVVEKLLIHPKRYLIDKMILENVPDTRIAEYFKTKLDVKINRYDIACYKKSFFNIKTQDIEERIQYLEAEKTSLEQLIQDIDNLEDYADMDLGERMLVRRQSETRIEELNDNIKTLNAMYSEYAFQSAVEGQNDFLGIFTDIVVRGYNRFKQLDNYKDRDVVDPLVKTAKMMAFAHDKVESIKTTGEGGKNSGVTDTHSQSVIMQLYKQRMDDIAQQQIKRANEELAEQELDFDGMGLNPNINPDYIAGIDELGMNLEFTGEEDSEEEK
jgi:hypothetical protein